MFTKVKHSKGTTELSWKNENTSVGEVIEHKLTSSDMPRPELIASLQAFAPYVVDICEFSSEYEDGMTVIGISISENEAMGYGIVVTALRKVEQANSPVVINTPYLSAEGSCEGGPKLPSYVAELLAVIEREAEMYRNGTRAQQELALR